MKNLTEILLFAMFTIQFTSCARILGIVAMPSYSHQVMFRPLWRELSLRGHHVTVLTTDPMNDPMLPNITEIDLHHSYNVIEQHDAISYVAKHKLKIWKVFAKFAEMTVDLLEDQLTHPEVAKLINDKEQQFDVVLVEMFFLSYLAFGTKFDCPYIGILSLDATSYLHSLMGNPTNPAMYTEPLLPFAGKMTYFQRLISTVFQYLLRLILMNNVSLQNAVVSKYFGDDIPHLDVLLSNASLFFLNANPILHAVRPVTPATILIGGGTHLVAPKDLPTNLVDILNCQNIRNCGHTFGHQVVFRPIGELSLRGHQVTVIIIIDPMEHPNFTNLSEIDVHGSYTIQSATWQNTRRNII